MLLWRIKLKYSLETHSVKKAEMAVSFSKETVLAKLMYKQTTEHTSSLSETNEED